MRFGWGRGPGLHWWSRVLLLLVLLLALDYTLYPLLSGPGAPTANRGENGLWLRYHWYFGRRTEAQTRELAGRLREQQIR